MTNDPDDKVEVLQLYSPGSAEWRIRADASLVILSEVEPPAALADAVGLEPDRAWSKGELLRAGGRRRNNGVEYHSGLGKKHSPTEHLAALVKRLSPYAARIAELSLRSTTHSVTVWVVEHTISDNPMVDAEPGDLGVVAAMNARLAVDVYFDGEFDE